MQFWTTKRRTVAAAMSGIYCRIFSATENFCFRRGGTQSECISRLISSVGNSQCAIRPAYPATGVNRLRCDRCAYRFRRDAECRFARMSPNERDIARALAYVSLRRWFLARTCALSLSFSCRLVPAARCGVGVSSASRHTQREPGGFTGGTPGGATGWPASPSPGGCNLLLRDPATYADLLSSSFMCPLVPLRPFFRVVPRLTGAHRSRVPDFAKERRRWILHFESGS